MVAARTVLVASPHFVIEQTELPASSSWTLSADRETWILVIEGHARIGLTDTTAGNAIFAKADSTGIEVGLEGMSCLIAYPGPDPDIALLQETGKQMTKSAGTSAVALPKPSETVEAQT